MYTTLSDTEIAMEMQVPKTGFNDECTEECINSNGDNITEGQNKTKDDKGSSNIDCHGDEEAQEKEDSLNVETTVDVVKLKGEISMPQKPLECETAELDDLNDVFLVMDGRRLAASKVVLCLASPVFKSMVESSMSHKQEIHLYGKKYNDVKEFYKCIDPRTLTPVTDENIYTVLPLIYEFKVECLLRRCHVFLPDRINEFTDAKELCRHLHLAVHYSLFDLEVKCVSLCSELKLAEMVEWMSYYNIPDPVQLKVRDKSLHRHELEESDTATITQLYKHADEETTNDFPTLLCEELKQNHFKEALNQSTSAPASITAVNAPFKFGSSQYYRIRKVRDRSMSRPSGFVFGTSISGDRNDQVTAKGPLQAQSFGNITATITHRSATLASGGGTAEGFNFSKQTVEKETKILKILQGMRLFYKYLADTHSEMKRDVVQYMRSQMNNLSTKEREIYDLLPARVKHDVKGRSVKEIPDKN